MEKKIWTMPQVSVQEFAPNVCASSCGYQLKGSCIADEYYWWRNTGSATTAADVNFQGWGAADDVGKFPGIFNAFSSEENAYYHEKSTCDLETGTDRYWTTNVIGLSKTEYDKSKKQNKGLQWVFGVAAQVAEDFWGSLGGVIFQTNWHVYSDTVGEAVDRS